MPHRRRAALQCGPAVSSRLRPSPASPTTPPRAAPVPSWAPPSHHALRLSHHAPARPLGLYGRFPHQGKIFSLFDESPHDFN